MPTKIKGYRLDKSGKRLVKTFKHLDASAQARARGKPAKNPKWRHVRANKGGTRTP
jgi:hypothetical protein